MRALTSPGMNGLTSSETGIACEVRHRSCFRSLRLILPPSGGPSSIREEWLSTQKKNSDLELLLGLRCRHNRTGWMFVELISTELSSCHAVLIKNCWTRYNQFSATASETYVQAIYNFYFCWYDNQIAMHLGLVQSESCNNRAARIGLISTNRYPIRETPSGDASRTGQRHQRKLI